jgi:hypothetical protein
MLRQKTATRVGRFLMGVSLFAGLAGPAFAGNVYSWVTEDGTYAFTDDPKRIPAKHREEAEAPPMGDLKRYARYTVDRTGKTYTDRLWQRQTELRERAVAEAPAVSAAPAGGTGSGFTYSMPFFGGGSSGGQRAAQMQLGMGALGANDSDEPITVESFRMKPTVGQATRHWTIVKQGDRVLAVIKGEIRDRSPQGISESDYDF